MNPANTRQSIAQAQFDAKRALDFANNVAPGSPQARAAQQAYQQTMNYAAIANRTNNPYMTQQVIQSSRSGVNAANSLASNSSRTYSTAGSYTSPAPASPQAITPNSPSVSNVGVGRDFGCGRENGETGISRRAALLSFLISAEETLSINYIKEVLKNHYQELVDAMHLAEADKLAAVKHLGELKKPTSFGSFTSPEGTPYKMRSLSPIRYSKRNTAYHGHIRLQLQRQSFTRKLCSIPGLVKSSTFLKRQ